MNIVEKVVDKIGSILFDKKDEIDEEIKEERPVPSYTHDYKMISKVTGNILNLSHESAMYFSNRLYKVGINVVRFGPCDITVHEIVLKVNGKRETPELNIYQNKLGKSGIWIDTEFSPESSYEDENRYKRTIHAIYRIYTMARNRHKSLSKEKMILVTVKSYISIKCEEDTTIYDTIMMDSLNKYADKMLGRFRRFHEICDVDARIPSIINDDKPSYMLRTVDNDLVVMDSSIINFRSVNKFSPVPENEISLDSSDETMKVSDAIKKSKSDRK